MTPEAVEEILESVEAELREVGREREENRYRHAVGAAKTDEAQLDRREAGIWTRPDHLDLLRAAASDPAAPGLAPHLRRLTLHELRSREGRIRTDPVVSAAIRSLSGAIDDYRRGSVPPLEIQRRLKRAPNRAAREEAWFQETPLSEAIEGEVSALIGLRNERAVAVGARDFLGVAYGFSEMSRIEFMGLSDELEELTRAPYEEFLEYARGVVGVETLEPWDLDFALATLEPPTGEPVATAEELVGLAERLLGLPPESCPPVHRGSLRDRPADCFPIQPPRDVRVVATERSEPGDGDALLRAFGQGLYWKHLPPDLALQWESPISNRAMGALFEQLVRRRRSERWIVWREVFMLRRKLAAALFEMLASERPGADLHSVSSEIQEHVLGFPRHPERVWAADVNIITRPLEGPNYMMSRLVAAQVAEHWETSTGISAASEWKQIAIMYYWMSGAAVPWDEKVRHLTDKPVDPEAFLVRLGIPLPS